MTKRIAWLTDIHLEFVDEGGRTEFCKRILESESDAVVVTGDIATADSIIDVLSSLAERLRISTFFTLGNHDFYGGSIWKVREEVRHLVDESSLLHWLPESDVVELTENTCLIGHDSYADSRLGSYQSSDVELSDYALIEEFSDMNRDVRPALMKSLADEAAHHFRRHLPEALARYSHIIVATHAPPFREACWHESEISSDDYLPHFVCKVVGDVLREFMLDQTDADMVVLCGHTHSEGIAQILPNLLVKTGGAEYGAPRVQEVILVG